MKLSTTLVYLSTPFIVVQSLPKCSELSDNEEKFDIEGFEIAKPCDWAARQDTIHRCFNYNEVTENCPITCKVPCLSEIPSASPSTSFPSLAPSSSPTDFMLCEDKVDNTERFPFPFPGTQGGETRSCNWAARMDTNLRCSYEPVRRNCPQTCDLPCRDAVVEEPREDGISSIIETPETKSESFPYAAVFGSGGVIAGLALIAYITQKQDGNVMRNIFSKDSNTPLEQHNLNPLEFDDTDDAVDEGYNSALCGWGSTASNQKAKAMQPVLVGEV